jgi:hypothetical protein
MPWFNVDDGFANSKPVLRIPRRYRCAALGLWTLAGSWSAKELMDGFIPEEALHEFASTPAMAQLLVGAGLWRRVEGGWQFENWAKYQRTKAQVYAYRAAEAERKQRYRSKVKPADSEGVSHGMSQRDTSVRPAGTPGGVRSESALPIPTPEPTPNQVSNSLTLVEGGVGGDPPNLPVAAKAAPANQRRKRIPDGYMPNGDRIAKVRCEFPSASDLTLKSLHEDFCLYWQGQGKPMADWDATWLRWIRQELRKATTPARNGHHLNGAGKPTQKAMGYQESAERVIAAMEEIRD